MWYALAELFDGYDKTLELYYGAELADVAAKLEKICDEQMQFDLEEMAMDEIDAYYTEGYDEYEAMTETPSEETISGLHFACNDGKIDVFTVEEGYAALQDAFALYRRGKLKGWKLADGVAEEEGELQKLAEEWKALARGTADTENLQYFTKG